MHQIFFRALTATTCEVSSLGKHGHNVASFPGSPLAPTKNKNGGREPGTDSHVISRHDDFALTIK